MKRIPLGTCNFEELRNDGSAYVDKTRFIEVLENESNKNLFFTRPRKFGKSLFLTTLYHYYSVHQTANFDKLFGDLYIGRHPTPNKNNFFVLNFDFSGLNTTDAKSFAASFDMSIMFSTYSAYGDCGQLMLPGDAQRIMAIYHEPDEQGKGMRMLGAFLSAAQNAERKVFVIIDEYDHFANDLLANPDAESQAFYKQIVRANSVVRDFYETLKNSTKKSIERILLTGITPMVLDDITSGFNISHNISQNEEYNDILGFTEDEVQQLIDDLEIDRAWIDIDMKKFYNGYLFHRNGRNRLYNSNMVLYYLNEVRRLHHSPDYIVDENLKMDYGRLKGLLSTQECKDILLEIAENGATETAEIKRAFSIDDIHVAANFRSLLFYMGLLTIDKTDGVSLTLKIPNYSIKTTYWEYIEKMSQRMYKFEADTTKNVQAIRELVTKADPNPFISFFMEEYVKPLSNRDLIRFDEKYLKVMLLAALRVNSVFYPLSELEISTGYGDIFLMRKAQFLHFPHDWLIEMKYVKKEEADEPIVAAKLAEAKAQLAAYRSSYLFKDRTDVKYLAIVFVGKDRVEVANSD